MKPRARVGTIFALAATALLVVPLPFISNAPSAGQGEEAEHASTMDAAGTAKDDLARVLDALPPEMHPAWAMGSASHWLFEDTPQGSRLRDAPNDVTEIFDRVRVDTPYDRMPIPEPPEGSEPLLDALREYSATLGIELPKLSSLQAQIASLRLQHAAEDALSQLILAYTQAAQLEAEAIQGLSTEELLFLHQEPQTVGAWLDEDPARTAGDVEGRMAQLMQRIDFSDRLRAADLLMRTIEATKDDIGLPPAPLHTLQIPDSMPHPDGAAASADVRPWPATGNDSWDQIYRLIGAPRDHTLPEVPEEDLVEALQKLAVTIGAGEVEVPSVDHLPPSLTSSVAKIVTARRIGLESGDAMVHTQLLLDATRQAEPTLRAWASVLSLQQDGQAQPDVGGLIAEASHAGPSATTLIANGLNTDVADVHPVMSASAERDRGDRPGVGLDADVLEPAPTLADVLVQEGVEREEAIFIETQLPPQVTAGLAVALQGLQLVEANQASVFGVLTDAQRKALDAGPPGDMLTAPSWSHAQAKTVQDWADGMAAIGPEGFATITQSQLEAVAAVEAAAKIFTDYTQGIDIESGHPTADAQESPDPLDATDSLIPSTTAPTSHTDPLQCNDDLPGSDCGEDIWLYIPQGRGILLTGFHETRVDTAITGGTNPGLTVDLGGRDVYHIAVGAVDGADDGPTRITIDAGGDDEYQSTARLAHGAASGLGAVGLLWDVAGNDVYRHECLDAADCVGAQGYGTLGAIGAIVDETGADTYDASQSWAHGVGFDGFTMQWIPNLSGSTINNINEYLQRNEGAFNGHRGIGVLLDNGAGDDILRAGRGQGYAGGDLALGLLLNQQGKNEYETSLHDVRFQGGYLDGTSAFGILVDLGGEGTMYSNHAVPPGSRYIHHDEDQAAERRDEAIWLAEDRRFQGTDEDADYGISLGLGIDSTFDDEDSDQAPNAMELLLGSDPEDPADPGAGTLDQLVDMLQELVENPPDNPEEIMESLPDPLFRDDALCHDLQCTEPVSLLHIGGPLDSQINDRALILIELGGDDVYTTEVAGPGGFHPAAGVSELRGVGSYAFDLGGSDRYDTPGMEATQASVDAALPSVNFCPIGAQVVGDECPTLATSILSPASILLDASGDDEYRAGQRSQGSIWTTAYTFVYAEQAPAAAAAAWLIDFSGDDEYTGGRESQAHANNHGIAGLLDLSGDDAYSFVTQGVSERWGGAESVTPVAAVFYDGNGTDTYDGSRASPAYDGTEATAFEHQGASPPAGTANAGAFIDEGTEYDRYTMVDSLGGPVDLSALKNNQTRPSGNNQGVFVDSPVWMANTDDDDDDGAPKLLEFLLFMDDGDAEDHPGTLFDDSQDLEASKPLLRIPDRLSIYGRGPSVIQEPSPFIVSLGGDDEYRAPFIGANMPISLQVGPVDAGDAAAGVPLNSIIRHLTTIVLDAGGNDNYIPDPNPCSWTELPDEWHHDIFPLTDDIYLCPSLGAAWLGTAIVADNGGENLFRTVGSVDMTWDRSRNFRLLTQGAAHGTGIGVLATWDSTNTFEADLDVRLEQDLGQFSQPLAVSAWALAQGASEDQGIGVLANFGKGQDIYRVNVQAAGGATPSASATAQGAALGGVGILLDGGGDNVFETTGRRAHGSATGTSATAALWTGTGDDTFQAGRLSQGTGIATGTGSTMGLLHDAGGSDKYLIVGPDGASALSQGASQAAVGILVDMDGDDTYSAPGLSNVQGYAEGGFGSLLEAGGHDRYLADSLGQAVASSQNQGTTALLVDVHGNDAYSLNGPGQGFSQAPGCALSAVFVDMEGTDVYTHTGEKNAIDAEVLGDGGDDENDWTWHQTPACATPGAIGVDSSELGQAMTQVHGVPGGLSGVDLDVLHDSMVVEDEAFVDGVLTLVADVDVQPAREDAVERVTFFHGNNRIADGEFQGADDGLLRYTFDWATEGRIPDGTYDLWASASLDTSLGQDAGATNTPTTPSVQSGDTTVIIDNRPEVKASIAQEIISSAPGRALPVTISVGRDHGWPATVDRDTVCADAGLSLDDCPPGAFIQIHANTATTTRSALEAGTYLPNGTHTIELVPRDDEAAWPDGWYELEVVANDETSATTHPIGPLLVDGRPPESVISTPGRAGVDSRGPGSSLVLEVESTDDQGSGIDEVCIFRIGDTGEPMASDPFQQWPQCSGSGDVRLNIGGVTTGDTLTFAAAARDLAGNLESPCQSENNEIYPCIEDRLGKNEATIVTADFSIPTIADVWIDGLPPDDATIRPGEPTVFTAEIEDFGTGIDEDTVIIHLPGGLDAQMTHTTGNLYTYESWHLHNTASTNPVEEEFSFVIEAQDLARNDAMPAPYWAVLDGLAPRITPLDHETEYVEFSEDGGTVSRPVGRSGLEAQLHVRVEDAQVADVRLLPGPASTGPSTCHAPADGEVIWQCRFILADLPDGEYDVPIEATDGVGNNATAHASIEIQSRPPGIQGIEIEEIRHNGFKLRWHTPNLAQGAVDYGRGALQQTVQETGYSLDHVIDVTGLTPSTDYNIRIVSDNQAGVRNQTPIMKVTTENAYVLEVDVQEDEVVSGQAGFAYDLISLAGDSPVELRVLIQDAAAVASPIEMSRNVVPPGQGTLTVDTTRLADGAYHLIVEADRLGDFLRVRSMPFRIDNTAPAVLPIDPAPGTTISDSTRPFQVALVDPMGRAPPLAETLHVEDGHGNSIPIEVLEESTGGAASLERTVSIRLLSTLMTGPYRLHVRAEDEAGNSGVAEWPFQVDTEVPSLVAAPEVIPIPGPVHAKPGGQLRIEASLQDPATVASVQLDLSPLAAGQDLHAPLLRSSDHSWKATIDIPDEAPHGSHMIPIVASDGLGNSGVVGSLHITIDARPLEITNLAVDNVGHTTAQVIVRTDQASRAWLGDAHTTGEPWARSHVLDLEGLVPGRAYTMTLRAVDQAGHLAEAQFSITTQTDDEPPTAARDLSAHSNAEGRVLLSWRPATDNSGISHYNLHRSAAPRAPAATIELTGNTTSYLDSSAPAGRVVTYTLVSVDLAAHAATATVDANVLALPRLSDGTITSPSGRSNEPFTITVEYRHAGDQPADRLVAYVGAHSYPLQMQPDSAPCHQGCTYTAAVFLPASTMFEDTPSLLFEAETDGQSAQLEAGDVPFVMQAGASRPIDDSPAANEAPSPGILTFVLIFLLVGIQATRKSRNEP